MTFLPDTLANQKVRAYLYRVLCAAGAVALFYGLMSAEEVAVWAGAVAVLFGVPAYNTPTQ